MRREWKEEPDEPEEVSLEETQEYRVPDAIDEIEEDPEDYEEAPEDFDETREFDEAPVDEYEEDFEDDYYYEDDDFVDEEDEDRPADEADEKVRPGAEVKQALEPLASRIKAVWAALAAQARDVDMPSLPEKSSLKLKSPRLPKGDRRLVVPVALIVVTSLIVGFGAYAIGKGSGDDVDVARLEGEAAGKQAGAIAGASSGYAAGFKKGRDAGFRKAYEQQYRIHFKRAFEQADLEVPSNKDFEVPEP